MSYKTKLQRGFDKASERLGELFGWVFNGLFLYFGLVIANWIYDLF